MLLKEKILSCFVGVPGVLSVQPDKNFGSENKDYGGESLSLFWLFAMDIVTSLFPYLIITNVFLYN